MKTVLRFGSLILFAVLLAVPVRPVFAAELYQESLFDKIGDWTATVGKKPSEKRQILSSRRYERQRKYERKRKVVRDAKQSASRQTIDYKKNVKHMTKTLQTGKK